MSRTAFVRALWGDSFIWRHERALMEVQRAMSQPHQPEPNVTYAFGTKNADFLRECGLKPEVLSLEPVVDFHGNGERNPEGYGGYNFGVSMWRHKLEVMRVALRSFGAIVWMDWDCFLREPLPDDFWDRMAQGAPVQITLVQYHVRTCTWRKREKRVVPEGAFIYCRDAELVEDVITLYRKWPKQIDQTLFAYVIDQRCDGWKGPDHYRAEGYEPHCHTIRNQLFEPEVSLFATIRGPKRAESLPDDPAKWGAKR